METDNTPFFWNETVHWNGINSFVFLVHILLSLKYELW